MIGGPAYFGYENLLIEHELGEDVEQVLYAGADPDLRLSSKLGRLRM